MKYVFILLNDCEIEKTPDVFFIFCYMLRNSELKTMTRVERERLLLTLETVIWQDAIQYFSESTH